MQILPLFLLKEKPRLGENQTLTKDKKKSATKRSAFGPVG
jgi:hypothetical protein